MKIIKSLIISLFLVSVSYAAPTVSSTSGTWDHGASVTISGSGFGTKSPAAPILWDNFEGGTNASALHDVPTGTPWALDAANGTDGVYSNTRHYGTNGALSAYMYLTNAAVNHTYAALGNQTKVFASYHFYHPSGYSSANMKMGRIAAGMDVHAYTYMGYTATNAQYYYLYPDINLAMLPPATYTYCPTNTWTRDDYYLTLGTLNTADGAVGVWRNGSEIYWNGARINRTASSGSYLTTFILPYYTESGDDAAYVDDVYIDNTLQRVEVCTGSTWATRGACEIQIPSAWSDTSATVTVNQGAFADSSSQYLYVVDAAGAANSSGLEITFGSSGGGGGSTGSLRSGVSASGVTFR